MVLLHQLFHVREYENLAPGKAGQFGNHQAFAGAGWQHNDGRFVRLAKMIQRGVDSFLLVGAERERSFVFDGRRVLFNSSPCTIIASTGADYTGPRGRPALMFCGILTYDKAIWKLARMSPKRRSLIIMLILWLPVQGLAAGLLHCDIHAAQTAADEPSSLHQHHAQNSHEAVHEHHRSASNDTGHHANHKHPDAQHADPCQQCCQVCTTLIPSYAPAASPDLATPVMRHAESADSIISDPLFHPPQNLS